MYMYVYEDGMIEAFSPEQEKETKDDRIGG